MQRDTSISDPFLRLERTPNAAKITPSESMRYIPPRPHSEDTLLSYEQDERVVLPIPSEFNSGILKEGSDELQAESGIGEYRPSVETVVAAGPAPPPYESSSSL